LGISNRKFISCMWVHLVVPFSHGFVFILCRSNNSVSRSWSTNGSIWDSISKSISFGLEIFPSYPLVSSMMTSRLTKTFSYVEMYTRKALEYSQKPTRTPSVNFGWNLVRFTSRTGTKFFYLKIRRCEIWFCSVPFFKRGWSWFVWWESFLNVGCVCNSLCPEAKWLYGHHRQSYL
jgi:hypothetical protein